jgi:hypothetical protein
MWDFNKDFFDYFHDKLAYIIEDFYIMYAKYLKKEYGSFYNVNTGKIVSDLRLFIKEMEIPERWYWACFNDTEFCNYLLEEYKGKTWDCKKFNLYDAIGKSIKEYLTMYVENEARKNALEVLRDLYALELSKETDKRITKNKSLETKWDI